MQTQPSPATRPQPVSPHHFVEEPESRLAQDAIPYQGPSQRNYKGRFRLMLGILGVFFVVSAALMVRVLTQGGSGETGEKASPEQHDAPNSTPKTPIQSP